MTRLCLFESQITRLNTLDLEQYWVNQENINPKLFKIILKTRLNEYFGTQWINTAKNSHTGLDYLELVEFDCQMKNYLNLKTENKEINALLKLRTGNHHLAVRTGCYRDKLIYEERICKLCNLIKVETVYHFMIECPRYADLREQSISFLVNKTKSEFYNKINLLKPSELKSISKYLEKANDRRNETLLS